MLNYLIINLFLVCFIFVFFYFFACIGATILGKICYKTDTTDMKILYLKEKKSLFILYTIMSILLLFFEFCFFFWYLGSFAPLFSDKSLGIMMTFQETLIKIIIFLIFSFFYLLIIKIFNIKMLKIKRIFLKYSRDNNKAYDKLDYENKFYIYTIKSFYCIPLLVFLFEIL